jgi:hypothetical protein
MVRRKKGRKRKRRIIIIIRNGAKTISLVWETYSPLLKYYCALVEYHTNCKYPLPHPF